MWEWFLSYREPESYWRRAAVYCLVGLVSAAIVTVGARLIGYRLSLLFILIVSVGWGLLMADRVRPGDGFVPWMEPSFERALERRRSKQFKKLQKRRDRQFDGPEDLPFTHQ